MSETIANLESQFRSLIEQVVAQQLPALVEEKLRAAEDQWLSVEDAHKFSGLSPWTIRHLARQGKIKKFQPNPGKPPVRISRNSLQEFMSA
jgi:hypothetical protein